MSCLSRLLGLICAVVPGLLFLAFSARFFVLWPQLGYVIGPLYSLVSFVTGAICLYLGVSILFGKSRPEQLSLPAVAAPATAQLVAAEPFVSEPVPAPLPEPLLAAPLVSEYSTSASIFAESNEVVMSEAVTPAGKPLDTPEIRIRQLALGRSNWQVTAAQLAHLTNLNMGVADAAAREMVRNGEAQLLTGPNGETVYLFDLAPRAI